MYNILPVVSIIVSSTPEYKYAKAFKYVKRYATLNCLYGIIEGTDTFTLSSLNTSSKKIL